MTSQQILHRWANIATPPKVTAVSTDGTPTNSKDGAEGEVMLDVEVVAGVCPKAHIVVYFASWSEQGWITILDAAVQDDNTNNSGVISISWGNVLKTPTSGLIPPCSKSTRPCRMPLC